MQCYVDGLEDEDLRRQPKRYGSQLYVRLKQIEYGGQFANLLCYHDDDALINN